MAVSAKKSIAKIRKTEKAELAIALQKAQLIFVQEATEKLRTGELRISIGDLLMPPPPPPRTATMDAATNTMDSESEYFDASMDTDDDDAFGSARSDSD